MNGSSANPAVLPLLGVGLLGGALAGFFGVGGGIVMVPLLMWWANLDQRRAQATSLLAIAPAAVVGAASYGFGGVFPLMPAALVSLGAIGGAQLGAFLLQKLPLTWLRWVFVAFVAVMALSVMSTVPERNVHISVSLGSGAILIIIGISIGISAGLFGIGGGILAIPLLIVVFGTGDIEAKSVSLIAMAPAAVSGSIAHLRHKTADPRDGFWIASSALVAAPLGALGAFMLPETIANTVFGLFALAIALVLAIKAWRDSLKGN